MMYVVLVFKKWAIYYEVNYVLLRYISELCLINNIYMVHDLSSIEW